MTEPTQLFFDTDSRLGTFAKLNTWNAGFTAGAPRPEVQFNARAYTLDAPIDLRSGMRLLGTRSPAREFQTGCVFKPGNLTASMFRQVANTQGYRSDGSARAVSVQGIMFYSSIPVLPKYNVNTDTYRGHTWWYYDFHDCGFVVSDAIAVGWGDGLTFSGITHVQACRTTPFYVGGSENGFGSAGISFLDSDDSVWMGANLPFFNMFSDKWTLSDMMISARMKAYQVLVSGGGNGRISRVYFDAPDGQPTSGAQLRITGGRALTVSDCSFKGGAGISVTGGSGDIVINACVFSGNPGVLTIGPNFTGTVFLGLNSYEANAGITTPKTVKVARASQLHSLDSRIQVVVTG